MRKNAWTYKEYFTVIYMLIVGAWIVSMLNNSGDAPARVGHGKYVTYDKEGDWILWDVRPHLEDGVWMPPDGEDFNCTSISDEAASILIN